MIQHGLPIGSENFIALSSRIEQDKKAYYQALERANTSLDITEWLVYFSEKILEAQVNIQKRIAFIIDKTRYFEMYNGKLNDRQTKVVLRLFQEGLAGFKGGLSAENYIRIVKTSRATTTRDLAEMVDLGALRKEGKLRHTRYYLPIWGIAEDEG